MKSYRLVIRQQGRIVGHFDTTGEAALEDACVARSLFGLAGGYQCDLLVSTVSVVFWRARRRDCASCPGRSAISR